MQAHWNMFLLLSTLLVGMLTLTTAGSAPPEGVPAEVKARIVVMTDIGGDPDDRQSMVRFLLYACDFDVEGLCTGFGHGHYEVTHPEMIRDAVEAYGKVLPSLLKHRADFPSREELAGLIKDGHNGDPHSVGPGMDSEASEWIIRVLDRDDPRPVWFSIWGGPRELAQAIWKVSQTRSPKELTELKRKIRVHSIADQDRTAGWVNTPTCGKKPAPRRSEFVLTGGWSSGIITAGKRADGTGSDRGSAKSKMERSRSPPSGAPPTSAVSKSGVGPVRTDRSASCRARSAHHGGLWLVR